MAVAWSRYNTPENDALEEKYLPTYGQGNNMATQVITAVTKLVYKWYNDGDVFDNTYGLEGWLNDLSSYANWLYEHVPESRDILDMIFEITTDSQYEDLLWDLNCTLLTETNMAEWELISKRGDIYNCSGPFRFEENEDEEEDEED